MLRRLFSNLSHALVAVAALAALVLSITTVVALREARSIQVENAAERCRQDIRQQNSGSNNTQKAKQNCSVGGAGGGLKQVVARARGSAPVTARANATPYPLRGNTWTQGARETDQFVGEAVYTGRCRPNSAFTAADIEFRVDGRYIGGVGLPDTGRRGPHKETFQVENGFSDPGGPAVLFEPARNKRRTLTARVSDGCGDGSRVVIRSLKVNVLGFR